MTSSATAMRSKERTDAFSLARVTFSQGWPERQKGRVRGLESPTLFGLSRTHDIGVSQGALFRVQRVGVKFCDATQGLLGFLTATHCAQSAGEQIEDRGLIRVQFRG